MHTSPMRMKTSRQWMVPLAGLLLLVAAAAHARPGQVREQTLETKLGRLHVEVLKEHMGEGDAVMRCRVTDAASAWPAEVLTLLYQTQGEWRAAFFRPVAGADQAFEAVLPNAGRGVTVPYYLEVEHAPGAAQRLPASGPADPFRLTFKGRPSTPLIIAHVVCMMGGLGFLIVAMFGAALFLRNGRSLALHRRASLIGFALLFIGGIPLGIAVEWQVFGTYWEGWPFGRDVTDTKTGVILILWLILLLVRGRDLWSRLPSVRGPRDRSWALWLIAITVFTVGMYLVPHENIKF